jgi:O-antigen/teichoic acid export membrane protein
VPPNTTADALAAVPQPHPTAGMTTRVVKGSFWTLVGQVGPLPVSLVTTPFVIRMLGAESYGILILVSLIPTYLAFGDFGMGLASTKFASEAYGEGALEKEARIVRTAALIALCSSIPVATVIIAFTPQIVSLFNVPENLLGEASLALKFAAATLVVNFLNGIFNTPQIARLRMDINALVNAGFRILGLIATPFAIYYNGVVGAVFVLMVASILTMLSHLFFSSGLTRQLFDVTIERSVIRPLLKFGGGIVVGGVAAVLLGNLEKAVLARTTDIKTLAYYSVAFNFAMMATLFSGAMIQTLIPAFSQLMTPGKWEQLNGLFSRALRMNIIGMLPILAGLFVIARPLFTIWAGR